MAKCITDLKEYNAFILLYQYLSLYLALLSRTGADLYKNQDSYGLLQSLLRLPIIRLMIFWLISLSLLQARQL